MKKKYKKLTKRYQTLHFVIGAAFVALIWIVVSMLWPMGKVDGQLIYKYQVNDYVESAYPNAIKNLAKTNIFYKAMSDLNVSVPETDVDAEMETVVKKYGSKEEFESILRDTTSNYASFRESVKKDLYRKEAKEILFRKHNYSDEDYLAYYNENNFEGEYESVKEQVIKAFTEFKQNELVNEYLDDYYDKYKVEIFCE